MSSKQLPISPFEYDDYRLFLADLTAEWKRNHRRWNYAEFSRSVGFASTNYLKTIIAGKRNLTVSAIAKTVEYFEFNQQETRFFTALVQFNQAKSDSAREEAFREMQKNQKMTKEREGAVNTHRFYSNWYNPVIREMVTIPDFVAEPKWISENISPKIPEREAERALAFLKTSGNIVESENETLVQAEPVSSTGNEIASLAVANYHREMMRLATESLDRLPSEKRNLSSLTMAVSKETYALIVEKIYAFQDEIISMVTNDSAPEEVCQLNFQLFPTTAITKNRGDK